MSSGWIAPVAADPHLFIDDTVLEGMQPTVARDIVAELQRLEAKHGIAVTCVRMSPNVNFAEPTLDEGVITITFSQGLFGVGNEQALADAFTAARALDDRGVPSRLYDTPAKVACHEYGHVLDWVLFENDVRRDAFTAAFDGDDQGKEALGLLSAYAHESESEAVAEAFLGYELDVDNPWCMLITQMLETPVELNSCFEVRHDPATGRFLPKDDAGGQPGSARKVTAYIEVNDESLIESDALGVVWDEAGRAGDAVASLWPDDYRTRDFLIEPVQSTAPSPSKTAVENGAYAATSWGQRQDQSIGQVVVLSDSWNTRAGQDDLIDRLGGDEVNGWTAPGTGSLAGVLAHEFGHAVETRLNQGAPGTLAAQAVARAVTKMGSKWAESFSSYGTTDPREMVAEAISHVALGGRDPGAVVIVETLGGTVPDVGQAATFAAKDQPVVKEGLVEAPVYNAVEKATLKLYKRLRRQLTARLRAFQRPPTPPPHTRTEPPRRPQLSAYAIVNPDLFDELGFMDLSEVNDLTEILGDLVLDASVGARIAVGFNLTPPTVDKIVADHLEIVGTMSSRLRASVTRWLTDAIDQGLSIPDMVEALEDSSPLSVTSALATAATEAVAAANAGAFGSWQAASIGGFKQWASAGDSRVRPHHEEADGQIVGIDEPFVVCDGQEAMYPGDPNLDAACRIRCRCTLLYRTDDGEQVDLPTNRNDLMELARERGIEDINELTNAELRDALLDAGDEAAFVVRQGVGRFLPFEVRHDPATGRFLPKDDPGGAPGSARNKATVEVPAVAFADPGAYEALKADAADAADRIGKLFPVLPPLRILNDEPRALNAYAESGPIGITLGPKFYSDEGRAVMERELADRTDPPWSTSMSPSDVLVHEFGHQLYGAILAEQQATAPLPGRFASDWADMISHDAALAGGPDWPDSLSRYARVALDYGIHEMVSEAIVHVTNGGTNPGALSIVGNLQHPVELRNRVLALEKASLPDVPADQWPQFEVRHDPATGRFLPKGDAGGQPSKESDATNRSEHLDLRIDGFESARPDAEFVRNAERAADSVAALFPGQEPFLISGDNLSYYVSFAETDMSLEEIRVSPTLLVASSRAGIEAQLAEDAGNGWSSVHSIEGVLAHEMGHVVTIRSVDGDLGRVPAHCMIALEKGDRATGDPNWLLSYSRYGQGDAVEAVADCIADVALGGRDPGPVAVVKYLGGVIPEIDQQRLFAFVRTLDFPVRHDPATGRFLPTGDAGGDPASRAEAPTLVHDVDEAIVLLAQGRPVELDQPREVSTLIDKLAQIGDDAVAKGDQAPVYNLCDVTVEGTNLFCADADTEILTTAGWRRYDQISPGDVALTLNHNSGLSEWQPLTAVNVFPAAARVMLSMECRGHSSLTTLEHRWPIVTRDGGRSWTTSARINYEHRVPTAAACANLPTEPKFIDPLVELVAWAWTEGTLRPDFRIYQSQRRNPGHCNKIRAALTALYGAPTTRDFRSIKPARRSRKGESRAVMPAWREAFNESTGMVTFHLNAAAAAPIVEHLDDRKIVDAAFVAGLTAAQLTLFVERSIDADGHRAASTDSFSQRVRERNSMFEMACALLGRRTSTTANPERRPGRNNELVQWTTTISRTSTSVKPIAVMRAHGVRDREMVVIHEGVVWCPTTPNGTWFARRNGSVYYTGNCTDTQGVPRVEMPQLKGDPAPGSWADENLERDSRGEIDLTPAYTDHLREAGVSVTDEQENPAYLRATQNELNGVKVAQIARAMEQGTVLEGAIWVSRDNYVLDGHHRWAAQVALQYAEAGRVQPIAVHRADIGIIEMLNDTYSFAKDRGLAPKPITQDIPVTATVERFEVRHDPATGRFLPKGDEGGAPGSARQKGPRDFDPAKIGKRSARGLVVTFANGETRKGDITQATLDKRLAAMSKEFVADSGRPPPQIVTSTDYDDYQAKLYDAHAAREAAGRGNGERFKLDSIPDARMVDGAIYLSPHFTVELATLERGPDGEDQVAYPQTWRAVAHELQHTESGGERGLVRWNTGLQAVVEEGGAEVLSIKWALDHFSPAVVESEWLGTYVPDDRKEITGAEAVVRQHVYSERTAEVLATAVRRVGWDRDAVLGEVERVFTGSSDDRMEFFGAVKGATTVRYADVFHDGSHEGSWTKLMADAPPEAAPLRFPPYPDPDPPWDLMRSRAAGLLMWVTGTSPSPSRRGSYSVERFEVRHDPATGRFLPKDDPGGQPREHVIGEYGGPGTCYATKGEHSAAVRAARKAVRDAPMPTEEQVLKGVAEAHRYNEARRLWEQGKGPRPPRAGGERSGSNEQRQRRAQELFDKFKVPGKNYCCCPGCGKKLKATVDSPGRFEPLTKGKIVPGKGGGDYQLDNLIPLCRRDNQAANQREVPAFGRPRWGDPLKRARRVASRNGVEYGTYAGPWWPTPMTHPSNSGLPSSSTSPSETTSGPRFSDGTPTPSTSASKSRRTRWSRARSKLSGFRQGAGTSSSTVSLSTRRPWNRRSTESFPVRHDPATGRFLPKDDAGGEPGSARKERGGLIDMSAKMRELHPDDEFVAVATSAAEKVSALFPDGGPFTFGGPTTLADALAETDLYTQRIAVNPTLLAEATRGAVRDELDTESDVGWAPARVSNIEGVLAHEMAHVITARAASDLLMDESYRKSVDEKGTMRFPDRLEIERAAYDVAVDALEEGAAAAGVDGGGQAWMLSYSRYGATSPLEGVAMAVADVALGGRDPGPLAVVDALGGLVPTVAVATLDRLDFPVRHDPATGRFLPEGDAGDAPGREDANDVPLITAEEARGNSRPVSAEEFQQLADEGKAMLDNLTRWPPTGLDDHWDAVLTHAYTEVQKPWGGATFDSHTGYPVESKGEHYALTIKDPGQESVTIPEDASPDYFAAAMQEARNRFAPQLEMAQTYLGVFHDDAHGRIDIDPVLVVSSTHEVDAVGAYTHAIGGAYHFASGNGYFPPHVAAAGEFSMADRKTTLAEFLAGGRDPNRPVWQPPGGQATVDRLDFPVRHDPSTGRFLPEGDAGGAPGEGRGDSGHGDAPVAGAPSGKAPTVDPVVQQRWAAWQHSLTTEEFAALQQYTDPDVASKTNWALRLGKADPAALEHAQLIESALAKAPAAPPPEVVYRGVVGAFADQLASMSPGETFVERGFTSTDLGDPYQGTKLEIHLRPDATRGGTAGVRAAFLGGLSTVADQESELLIGHSTRYQVREHRTEGDTRVVVLDVVSQGPADLPSTVAATVTRFAQTDPVNKDRFRWGPGEVEQDPSAQLSLVVDGTPVPWLLVTWDLSADPVAELTKHFHHAKWFSADQADLVAQGIAGDVTDVFLGPQQPLPTGLVTELRLSGSAELTIPLRDPKVRPQD